MRGTVGRLLFIINWVATVGVARALSVFVTTFGLDTGWCGKPVESTNIRDSKINE